jgi:hypothetical protein
MARPWKHPKTGIYWLRKRIPDDLRPLLGKREEKRNLGTRDPNEAKRFHARALAELGERWANLRSGPRAVLRGYEVERILNREVIDDGAACAENAFFGIIKSHLSLGF